MNEESDWLGGFDVDRSEDKARAARLANALGKLPGSRAHKLKWLEAHLPLLEAEAVAAGTEPGTARFGGQVVRLAFRFYRHHVLKLKAAGRAVPEETGMPQNVVELADRIGRKA